MNSLFFLKGLDGHPFPILGYANGPGFLNLRYFNKPTFIDSN